MPLHYAAVIARITPHPSRPSRIGAIDIPPYETTLIPQTDTIPRQASRRKSTVHALVTAPVSPFPKIPESFPLPRHYLYSVTIFTACLVALAAWILLSGLDDLFIGIVSFLTRHRQEP